MDTKITDRDIVRILWAKSNPPHPLWCHLLDTAAVCEQLINCFGCPEDIPPLWTMYLAALHDIGKADSEFQEQRGEGFRHESMSGDWVYRYLTSADLDWGEYAAKLAEAVLRSHHGNFKPKPCGHPADYNTWEGIRLQLAEIVADALNLHSEPFSPPAFGNSSSTGVKLIGLTVLSDWIASNEELFRYHLIDNNLKPQEYWQKAQVNAARAVETLQLDQPVSPIQGNETPSFRDIWPDIQELKPSQRTIEESCIKGIPPGLVIIEAPMGEGKTESAIYIAECWRRKYGTKGTYIALPTMATSNQMHHRYSEFLSNCRPAVGAPRLVHGMAWLIDNASPDNGPDTSGDDPDEEQLLAREWFSPSKRALIAPEGVGTIDQVLMAALNVKHGFLRLLGISSKTLIIDEVHAYDEYMTVILERLLEWCRTLKIPVIMLSATLSKPQKERLIEAYQGKPDDCPAYPLITIVSMDGSETKSVSVEGQETRKVLVEQHPGMLDDPKAAADLAVELVKDGGCACVLVNTVKHAQAVYKELKELLLDEKERYLFHARFPARRRSEIENQIVGLFGKKAVEEGTRPKKAVLVATQVVEQSIDLDFDVMISQLTPIDLLLQRIGRLWRHRKTDTFRPLHLKDMLHILMPDRALGDSKYVYGESSLLRTMAILENRDMFNLPHDFRPLIDDCYGDRCVISSMVSERIQRLADAEAETKKEMSAGKASLCLIPLPSDREFSLVRPNAAILRNESDGDTASYFNASTRLDSNTCPVMLLEDPVLIAAAHKKKAPPKDVLKELFLNKVDIPSSWIRDAQPADGDGPLFSDAKWLRRTTVIPLIDGKWRGTRQGKNFEITVDSILGVEVGCQ